jgi:hypothetical protein
MWHIVLLNPGRKDLFDFLVVRYLFDRLSSFQLPIEEELLILERDIFKNWNLVLLIFGRNIFSWFWVIVLFTFWKKWEHYWKKSSYPPVSLEKLLSWMIVSYYICLACLGYFKEKTFYLIKFFANFKIRWTEKWFATGYERRSALENEWYKF